MVALMRGAFLGFVLMAGPAVGQEETAPAVPANVVPMQVMAAPKTVSAPVAPPTAIAPSATAEMKAEKKLQVMPVAVRAKADTPAPTPPAANNPQTGATITLKPHNVRFDKTLTRHQSLVLQYIGESAQIDALVQRTMALQHRATLIERDLREARYVLSDTRSRKTKAALNEKIADWVDELASIGDDAQLANIDLQSALQKQQQTLQTMSNVSKMLHDTAMSVIRKIGG